VDRDYSFHRERKRLRGSAASLSSGSWLVKRRAPCNRRVRAAMWSSRKPQGTLPVEFASWTGLTLFSVASNGFEGPLLLGAPAPARWSGVRPAIGGSRLRCGPHENLKVLSRSSLPRGPGLLSSTCTTTASRVRCLLDLRLLVGRAVCVSAIGGSGLRCGPHENL